MNSVADTMRRIEANPGPYRKKFWRFVTSFKDRPRAMSPLRVGGVRLMTEPEEAQVMAKGLIRPVTYLPKGDCVGLAPFKICSPDPLETWII